MLKKSLLPNIQCDELSENENEIFDEKTLEDNNDSYIQNNKGDSNFQEKMS